LLRDFVRYVDQAMSLSVHTLTSRVLQAIYLLDSPRTRDAMTYVNSAVGPNACLPGATGLKSMLGANKNLGFIPQVELMKAHPAGLAERLLARIPDLDVDGLDQAVERLAEIGVPALHNYIWDSANHTLDIKQLVASTPILKLISNDFWTSAPVVLWATGWKNASAPRRKYTSAVILGWGLIFDLYPALVLESLFLHRRSWPLIELVTAACAAEGTLPWYDGQFDLDTLDALRYDAIKNVSGGKEWWEESEAQSDEELDVLPVTGKEPEEHLVVPGASPPAATPPESDADEDDEDEENDEDDVGKAGTTPPPSKRPTRRTAPQTKAPPKRALQKRAGKGKSSAGSRKKSSRTIDSSGDDEAPATAPNPHSRRRQEEKEEDGQDEQLEQGDQEKERDEGEEEEEEEEEEAGQGNAADDQGEARKGRAARKTTTAESSSVESDNEEENAAGAKSKGKKAKSQKGQLQQTIIDQMPPHPYALCGMLPQQLVDGYVGQTLIYRKHPNEDRDRELAVGLVEAAQLTLRLLPSIFQAREFLRYDVVSTILHALHQPRPFESMMDSVAATIYMHKVMCQTSLRNAPLTLRSVSSSRISSESPLRWWRRLWRIRIASRLRTLWLKRCGLPPATEHCSTTCSNGILSSPV
jgi:hypothetical protein